MDYIFCELILYFKLIIKIVFSEDKYIRDVYLVLINVIKITILNINLFR